MRAKNTALYSFPEQADNEIVSQKDNDRANVNNCSKGKLNRIGFQADGGVRSSCSLVTLLFVVILTGLY